MSEPIDEAFRRTARNPSSLEGRPLANDERIRLGEGQRALRVALIETDDI